MSNEWTQTQFADTTDPDEPVILYRDTNTAGHLVGASFQANNDAAEQIPYAGAYGEVTDDTDGAEQGSFVVKVMDAGTLTEKFRIHTTGPFITPDGANYAATSDPDNPLGVYRDTNTPGDQVGVGFLANNDAAEVIRYACLYGEVVDDTDGAEDGAFSFKVMQGGSETEVVTISEFGAMAIQGAFTCVGFTSTADGLVEADGASIKTTWAAYNGTPQIFGARAAGSKATPAVVSDDQILFQIVARGHDGTDQQNAAILRFYVDGTPANNDVPGSMELWNYVSGVATQQHVWNNAGDYQIVTGDLVVTAGNIQVVAMPTSNPGAGYLWNDSGTIKMGT